MTSDDLRSFRIQHNLPQTQLAEVLQISRHTLMGWEAGERLIPAWLGLALAAYDTGLPPYCTPPGYASQGRGRVSRIR